MIEVKRFDNLNEMNDFRSGNVYRKDIINVFIDNDEYVLIYWC